MTSTGNDNETKAMQSEADPGANGTMVVEMQGENAEEMLSSMGGIEIKYQPLDASEIPADVKKNLEADDARRLMMARNLAPISPQQMGINLYCLMADKKPAIRNAAEDSFDDLPPNILKNIASQPQPWKMLDYMVRNFYDDDSNEIVEAVIMNPATSVDTMLMLTRVASPKIMTIISNNQTRLIKNPQLVFEFPKNPRISVALVSSVLEFARRQKLITIEDENKLIDQFINKLKPEEDEPVPVEKFVEEIVSEDGEPDWSFPSFMTADFEADAGLDAEADVIEDKINSKANLRDLVRQMTVPQKMRLAVRGNMEARNILIEDSLSLVAKAVLKSPRLTKTEIERAAELRTIDSEVLEEIAKNGAFTRAYVVRHALVCNPKTPLPIANKFMSTLMEKDIKMISKSRAVPAAIQSIARQKMDAQEQRRKKRNKKKK